MTIENDKNAPESTESETATETQPRKLLLGKKVLRHFNVRSSIQTGALAWTDECTSQNLTIGQRTRQS